MKALQKAIHKKDKDVSKEKNEFEITRKELDLMLKQMKREIVDEKQEIDVQPKNTTSANRASSLGERISNDDQPNVEGQIHKYQNKVPNTLSARNENEMLGSRPQAKTQVNAHAY